VDLVVMAGTIGPEAPWTNGCPRTLLPLWAGRTLLHSLLDRFEDLPGSMSAVCANGHTDLIAFHTAGRRSQRRLVLFEDGVPRGAAGCLKAVAPLLTSETLFAACGSVWMDDDPHWMLEQHRAGGNALTVFCTPADGPQAEGRIKLTPAGVYCCERAALECIRPTGYQDLKEQWIPALQEAGLRVGAVVLPGQTREILAWSAYLRVLEQALSNHALVREGDQEVAPGVWYGEGVHVAPTARIVGPARLEKGCSIAENALVVGPVILGEGSRVGRGAWLVRVISPRRIDVPPGSCVADRLIPSHDMLVHPKGIRCIDHPAGMAIRFRPGDVLSDQRPTSSDRFPSSGVLPSTPAEHS